MNSRGWQTEKSIVVGCCWPPRRLPLALAGEEEECPSLEQGSFSEEESSPSFSPEYSVSRCCD